jgi:hypothetical protein
MTTTRTTPPPPPPPVTVTARYRNLRTGKYEVWEAKTPGWVFIRTEEPGTPWYAEATDTHLTAAFTSLIHARRAACGNLREVLWWNARRAAIRNGTLASHHTPARYRCACGGLLTDTPDGRGYRHIDGCTECTTVDTGMPLEAPGDELAQAEPGCCAPCDLEHVLCENPTPVPCARCGAGPARISVVCECGRDECCGCCIPG